jgi:hypothetical protein
MRAARIQIRMRPWQVREKKYDGRDIEVTFCKENQRRRDVAAPRLIPPLCGLASVRPDRGTVRVLPDFHPDVQASQRPRPSSNFRVRATATAKQQRCLETALVRMHRAGRGVCFHGAA